MKFTKQEQSLIKLAAAHMAPQMLKKATLQDKLAEYGIGMNKKAGAWDTIKGWFGGSKPIADAPIKTQPDQTAGSRKDAIGATPGSFPAGSAIHRLGDPMPSEMKPHRSEEFRAKYPYVYRRFVNSPVNSGGAYPYDNALKDIRLFDNVLENLQKPVNGVAPANTQSLVDSARASQARQLAERISAPGTNQYDDALRMLIQAGRNNQEAFENTGDTLLDTTETGGGGVPKNYKGPNRLNEEQLRQLWNYYPVMGATGNSRRFSNLS